ncbi:MAG: hypothetical protein AAF481_16040 [Acidobacteriota bacterium]
MSDDVKKGLDKLENVDITEISDEDLEGVSGGAEIDEGDCDSWWCCSNTNA